MRLILTILFLGALAIDAQASEIFAEYPQITEWFKAKYLAVNDVSPKSQEGFSEFIDSQKFFYGEGFASAAVINPSQRQIVAETAAEIAAYRRVVEHLEDFALTEGNSHTELHSLIGTARGDEARKRLKGFMKKYELAKVEYIREKGIAGAIVGESLSRQKALGNGVRLETFGRGTSVVGDIFDQRNNACNAAFVLAVERLLRMVEGFELFGDTLIKDGMVQQDQIRMVTKGKITGEFVVDRDQYVSDGALERDETRLVISDDKDRKIADVKVSMGALKGQAKQFIDWNDFPKEFHGIEISKAEFSPKDNICSVSVGYNLVTPDRPISNEAFVAERKTADVTPPIITLITPETKRGIKLTARESGLTVIGKAIDDSGVATVTVNDQEAALDAEGNFSTELLLRPGYNQVVVTAMDIYKNSATERFTISRQAGQVAKPIPASARLESGVGIYYALIIGNNDYRNMDRLQTAVSDARDVASTLREQYGFKTKLLLNATRKDILSAINDFRKTLRESDSFLVYYAGHGEFDKIAGKAYWLPVDAQKDDPADWIIADDITSSIKRLSSKHVLIVSDSCYSGTLTRNAQTNLRTTGEREEFLQKMMERPSRTLMASGGNEPVADGGSSGHSIFADSFLRALQEIERPVFTVDELFYQHIKSIVAGRSDQVPEYNEIRNSGHDGGDFVLIKNK